MGREVHLDGARFEIGDTLQGILSDKLEYRVAHGVMETIEEEATSNPSVDKIEFLGEDPASREVSHEILYTGWGLSMRNDLDSIVSDKITHELTEFTSDVLFKLQFYSINNPKASEEIAKEIIEEGNNRTVEDIDTVQQAVQLVIDNLPQYLG